MCFTLRYNFKLSKIIEAFPLLSGNNLKFQALFFFGSIQDLGLYIQEVYYVGAVVL